MLRVLCLGAGLQSTTILLMALEGEIECPDCAIFADTGWEPKAVYRHLEWLEEKCREAEFPLYRVSAGNIRDDVLAVANGERPDVGIGMPPFYVSGSGGMLYRKCTVEYKVMPIRRKIRELLGLRPRQKAPKDAVVEQWFGISWDERLRMRRPPESWIRNRYPLIELCMNRWQCMWWLRERGYPIPPKSSCIGCPYHSDDYWLEMKRERPDEWTEAVEFDRAIRHAAKRANGQLYLHRSLKPLDEVDVRAPEDSGQQVLWDDYWEECQGMCGV